jgi:glucosamine--fructose-6-phosphate aminotransferase (isomerizing)
MTTDHNHYAKSHTWNEILSQGQVWQTALDELRHAPEMEQILDAGKSKSECLFVGCGTSFYLAEAAAISWTLLTGQTARPVPASEILLYPKLFEGPAAKAQAIVISRSGRTSEAIRAANVLRKELRIPTAGITCAEHSELERACDISLVLCAADENSTVMTRSFTSMLLALQVLAARRAGSTQFADALTAMARQFSGAIAGIAERMEAFVAQHSFADYVFLGQGPFHGIAREAALKVMEMSCSYSQFFHALEFRHGPKAIVSPATCLTFFLSDTAQKTESEVLAEMKELGGIIVAVCNRADAETRKNADLTIEMNFTGNELALLAPYIVPCQLMGFFTGLRKGLNPDQPKNLTRVVILD